MVILAEIGPLLELALQFGARCQPLSLISVHEAASRASITLIIIFGLLAVFQVHHFIRRFLISELLVASEQDGNEWEKKRNHATHYGQDSADTSIAVLNGDNFGAFNE